MLTSTPCRRLVPGTWRLAGFLSVLVASCGSSPAGTHLALPSSQPFTPLADVPTWTVAPTTPIPPTSTLTFTPQPYDWSLGPEAASVTLVEYADFQSEACARLAPVLRQLQQAHPTDVRLVFRLYPLIPVHDKASLAAQAAHAAGQQGAFWPMHDLLFNRQQEWLGLTADQFLGWLALAATDLGLDTPAFERDLEAERFRALTDQAFLEAYSSGIPGTPVLYVNGALFSAELSPAGLEAAIRLELLREHQFAAFPPPLIQPEAQILARLVFDVGEMFVELYPLSAPHAVNSFVFLAQQGWFDSTPVHHVIPGVLIEMGDPTGTGLGGPGYFFHTEIDPSLTFDDAGVLALSSIGPDTNGSRFFITLKPLPELNGTHTIFGRALTGLDWAVRLPARDPMEDLLTPPAATLLHVILETR